MPRNVYFSNGSIPEQRLFEDLQIEALKIYGQETYYLPRKILTRDMILNEDRESLFDDAYMIEMYIEDIEGFGGEGNLMSKFGLEIRDEATFIVARRTWNKLVGTWNNAIDNFRPNEGDLIYLPLSNSLFEISFVEHEQPFYQIQNLPVYKLQCRLFEYNSEDFRTGIDEIDSFELAHGNALTLLINDITGDIEIGMRLYQYIPTLEFNALVERKAALPDLIENAEDQETADELQSELDNIDIDIRDEFDSMPYISGIVSSQEPINKNISNRNLYLIDIETNTSSPRKFIESISKDTYIVNATTPEEFYNPSVSANIDDVYDLDDDQNNIFVNDPSAQNFDFQSEADDIIDFSENNPFGEPR